MIRIAYVIDELESTAAGGSEVQLVRLLCGLDRTRFRPSLSCLHPSPWVQRQDFDFPVEEIGVKSVRSLRFWRKAWGFGRRCRRDQVDIVQTCLFDSDVFGAIAARVARRPRVVWSRRNVGHWHEDRHLRVLRRLRPDGTHYLGNSRAAVDLAIRAEGARAEAAEVIPNGIDLARFDGITPDMRAAQRRAWGFSDRDRVIGIVANLRALKNLDAPIRVLARLAGEFPDARLVSVGDGEMRAPWEALRDRLGLRDRVLFAGQTEDVVPCLAAFDFAILCSTHESLSNSVMEYMAAGLPVVVSRVGGNPELVVHEETGLLYDVASDDDLDSCLRRLLLDPSFSRSLGERARRFARENFALDACIRAHEALYERLVRERAHLAPGGGPE